MTSWDRRDPPRRASTEECTRARSDSSGVRPCAHGEERHRHGCHRSSSGSIELLAIDEPGASPGDTRRRLSPPWAIGTTCGAAGAGAAPAGCATIGCTVGRAGTDEDGFGAGFGAGAGAACEPDELVCSPPPWPGKVLPNRPDAWSSSASVSESSSRARARVPWRVAVVRRAGSVTAEIDVTEHVAEGLLREPVGGLGRLLGVGAVRAGLLAVVVVVARAAVAVRGERRATGQHPGRRRRDQGGSHTGRHRGRPARVVSGHRVRTHGRPPAPRGDACRTRTASLGSITKVTATGARHTSRTGRPV